MNRDRHEDGSAAVEIVLITPILIALLLFIVMLGRVEAAHATVDAAARDAARAASLTPDTNITAAGRAAAIASTRTAGLHCQPLTTTITKADTPTAFIVADVSCTVALGDLATGLHIPATRTITAHFTAPVDRYRSDP